MRVELLDCAQCGMPFLRVPGTPGRPRKYCSDTCTRAHLRSVTQAEWWARERKKRISRYGIW